MHATKGPSRHWIFDWLDENNITSAADAKRLLPKYKVLDSLRSRAEAASETAPTLPRNSILAGAGIDLSAGRMICSSPDCMRRQVDELLKHVWHYFDRTLVNDVLSPLLLSEWKGTKKALIREIVSELPALIYVNQIGAADFLTFVPKHFCIEGAEQHAKEQGLDEILSSREKLITHLLETAIFSKEKDEAGGLCYGIKQAGIPSMPLIAAKDKTEEQVRGQLAVAVFNETLAHLVADVAAARTCKVPLGTVVPFEGRMLAMNRRPDVPEVLFHLQLPVLEHLTVTQLMEIRSGEQEYFDTFRAALREAVEERLKSDQHGSAPAMAEQIRGDLIEPALESIRLRLAKSEEALAKKSGVGIFLGALATTCGVLYGLPAPLALSAGAGTAITATGVAANKYLEEQQQISLDDMYFLWKATEHAH